MPSWLSFDPSKLLFSGTPNFISFFNFTIIAFDGLGGVFY
jgi:hypothetical protein